MPLREAERRSNLIRGIATLGFGLARNDKNKYDNFAKNQKIRQSKTLVFY